MVAKLITDDDLRARAAERMGMKLREIVAVVDTAEGVVVTTHDGQRTLIRDDGSTVASVPEPVDTAPVAPAIPATPTGATPDPNAVPDGSATDVLTWVGEDKDRAARALAIENAKDKPRSTLVASLEKVQG